MADEYKPENVAPKCGLKADIIKNLAKEIAHVAFQEELKLDVSGLTGRAENIKV